MNDKRTKLIVFGILILAGVFRVFAVNWDQGFHLHPDERAIVLSVITMHPPHSLQEFLSPQSPWNPKFFAYGSFPFYLLRLAGNLAGLFLNPAFSVYEGINLVGRVLSAFFDLGTIYLLYQLGKRFFTLRIGLLAAFFYAISVLPIQLSHFYAVDTLLTFFVLATITAALYLEQNRTITSAIMTGVCLGLALATKFSAVVLLFPIATSLFYMLITRRRHHHQEEAEKVSFGSLILFLLLIGVSAGVIFFITEPYGILDWQHFLTDTRAQSQMTKDAFIFPYTLQYVGKIPYYYELKNIFLYGQGPLLALLGFPGFFLVLLETLKTTELGKQIRNLIILSFFIVYFLLVGGFKVGFMRYMLPVYPFLCLFGSLFALFLLSFLANKTSKTVTIFCTLLFALCLFVWPLSFMHVYTQPNTRVMATDWIQKHIPQGKTLAIEHWDDSLPLAGQNNYSVVTLPLYDPDNDLKWQSINATLAHTDYIIIASNRLYTPLMKLTDCPHLPIDKCYPKAAAYYKNLFSGKSNFKKVAEFSDPPTIPIINLPVNDQGADESFTVYDHPIVMIFQKIR